ncbi:pseudouridine synthase [Parashewanella curva]|uniref:Pseudouridine synthase n=1 Tax=Parashewanella curva TaxID=2338552 RepID=A0A3L8PTN6_9GAMM|nr:pseudouridine synthase [Parashewanella curva]RLV58770.1 pseudouridine synthase [Parashewanella curva]
MTSVVAKHPSYVAIPQDTANDLTVLEFLSDKYPQIGKAQWLKRMTEGKVHWQDKTLITTDNLCRPTARVYYYREVEQETPIPFKEQIIFENDNILVVNKPHFLPVAPGGKYINECLVSRLRASTGIETITPAHRLDKDTAGLILLTKRPEIRAIYHNLFRDGAIKKRYQAFARVPAETQQQFDLQGKLHWTVKNRLQKSNPSFVMEIVEGEPNSHSEISLLEINEGIGRFELEPVTGKTHQLRMHMMSLGMPILNDAFYPKLKDKEKPDFHNPLKLIAYKLSFIDPLTDQAISFDRTSLVP